MQKRILSGIVLWMALWAALIGCATAEDENRHILDISLVVNPTEMVEPQEVSLTFTITNNSSASAENVYISSFDGLLSEPIGLIAPGETQTVVRTHSVTQDELSEGAIAYIVTHDDPLGDTAKVNYTVRTAILRSEPQPSVEFTRRLSSEIVSPGDKAQNLDASFDPVQVPKIAFKRRQSVNCANPCRILRLFYRDIYPHAASQILSTVHATLT